MMLEYEKKIMLSFDEHATLSAMLLNNGIFPKTQTNYYFDNDELSMNRRGITCRIRAQNGKYKATIKNHRTDSLDCSTEADLTEGTEFNPQVFQALGLHYQGALITERFTVHKDSVCKVMLDRNIYLGYMDYELEVEYRKDGEPRAVAVIKQIAQHFLGTDQPDAINAFLSRAGQGKFKSQRFFDRLKNSKQETGGKYICGLL